MKRFGIWVVMLFALTPAYASLAGDAKVAVKNEFYHGKVVPLAELLKKYDAKLDEDAAAHWLALVTEDGKI